MDEIRRKKILIADDNVINRAILSDMLEDEFDIVEASDGEEAIALLQKHSVDIDLLLLDIVMPNMDGFDVLSLMNHNKWIEDIPVIMISAETATSYMERAYELGAADFINRPFSPSVVHRRIMNTITLYAKQKKLTELVAEQIYEKENNNELMISILSHIVEFRNGESGMHILRVNALTEMLLKRLIEKTGRYKFTNGDISIVRMAASLHDIGKISVPDEILNKPGRFTAEEYEIMKSHCVAGSSMMFNLPIRKDEKLVRYAFQICRWHHERWDGNGYPDKLKGDEIPIFAQVVSIADVYDALTSKRCYKEAYSHQKAMDMILSGECGVFNPLLLECLADIEKDLQSEFSAEYSMLCGEDTAKRVVDELYSVGEVSGGRTIRQLENERGKHLFYTAVTDELWFEFIADPPTLVLSHNTAELFGLPETIMNPIGNSAFVKIFGEGWLSEIGQRILQMPFDQTTLELDEDLIINGQKRRYRLTMNVNRSYGREIVIGDVIGRMIDIDDSYNALNKIADSFDEISAEGEESLPRISQHGVISMSQEQLCAYMRFFENQFDKVRVVDPSVCVQLVLDENSQLVQKPEECHSSWKRNRHCACCSSDVIAEAKVPQSRMEIIDDVMYHVSASCINVDGKGYVLELVSRVDDAALQNETNKTRIFGKLSGQTRLLYIDPVTGVYNRRYFDEKLRDLMGDFAFAMLDLDNFKLINDTFGHHAGDLALRAAAQAIKGSIRAVDDVVRYGGDEFFLLLRDMPRDTIAAKLDEIRRAVEDVRLEEFPDIHITVSIGGACETGKVSQIIYKADLALYKSKEIRNMVTISEQEE